MASGGSKTRKSEYDQEASSSIEPDSVPCVKVGVEGKERKRQLLTNNMSARSVLIDLDPGIDAIIPLGRNLNLPDIVESKYDLSIMKATSWMKSCKL